MATRSKPAGTSAIATPAGDDIETRVRHDPTPARGRANDQPADAVAGPEAEVSPGAVFQITQTRSGCPASSTIDQTPGPDRSGTAGFGSTAAQRMELPAGSSTLRRRPLSGTTS